MARWVWAPGSSRRFRKLSQLLTNLAKSLQGLRQPIEVELLGLLLDGRGQGTQLRPVPLVRYYHQARGKLLDFADGHRLAKSRPDRRLFVAQFGRQFAPFGECFRWHRTRLSRLSSQSRRSGLLLEQSRRFQEPPQFGDQVGPIKWLTDESFAHLPSAGFFLGERRGCHRDH